MILFIFVFVVLKDGNNPYFAFYPQVGIAVAKKSEEHSWGGCVFLLQWLFADTVVIINVLIMLVEHVCRLSL